MKLAEKLGCDKESKLLIIHADDGGFMQSVNRATQSLMENGSITSASYMMPAPWIYQAVDHYKSCNQCDMGLHIVLNSEWPVYRWGATATGNVKSLIDEFGMLWATRELYMERAKTEEVINEIRAQIEKAFKLGFKPSHMDTHMGTIYIRPEVLKAYVRLAHEYQLIPMVPKWSPGLDTYLKSKTYFDPDALKEILLELEKQNQFMLDRIVTDAGGSTFEERTENYLKMLKSLKPGLTQVIVHLSDKSDEFDTIIKLRPQEQRRYWDPEILQSQPFKETLASENIVLVSWRDIQRIQYPEATNTMSGTH
jgi:hypothetical protein